MIYSEKFKLFGIICASVVFFSACDEQTVSSGEMASVEIDSTKTEFVNVAGKLFSIPSPIQTAMLIKESEAGYNREVLNDPAKISKYISKNQRALNLGIYGTDMAYASLYDDSQASLRYFKAVENLADELEIKGAMDAEIVKRLGSNVGNADSLLILSGKFFEASDKYLKENDRYDLAALILAGGWVEASYLTALTANTGNEAARSRLAAQKKALATLCEVLEATADDSFNSGTTSAQLDSLNTVFKTVSHDYTFKQPETNEEKRLTVITSESTFNLSDEQLLEISSRLERLRASITE